MKPMQDQIVDTSKRGLHIHFWQNRLRSRTLMQIWNDGGRKESDRAHVIAWLSVYLERMERAYALMGR